MSNNRSIAETRGPGVHHATMVYAKNTTRKTMKEFERFAIMQCKEFGCVKCTPHCTSYIKKHPPTKHTVKIDKKTKRDLTAFEWTINYRNSINSRIGKPLISFENAYDAYYGEKFCNTGNCDSDDDDDNDDKLNSLSQRLPGVVMSYNDHSNPNNHNKYDK